MWAISVRPPIVLRDVRGVPVLMVHVEQMPRANLFSAWVMSVRRWHVCQVSLGVHADLEHSVMVTPTPAWMVSVNLATAFLAPLVVGVLRVDVILASPVRTTPSV